MGGSSLQVYLEFLLWWLFCIFLLETRHDTDLFHVNPRILDSCGLTPKCCLAAVWSSSTSDLAVWSSSLLTLEAHLCSLKVASSRITVAASFLWVACWTVSPSLMISSTLRERWSSSTSIGRSHFHRSKCEAMTPPRRNGDEARPNSTLVNLSVLNSPVFVAQWNRSASRSLSLMRIWRKAFSMSPVNATGKVLFYTSNSHILFFKGGPGYRHSFKEGSLVDGFAYAS